MHDGQCISTARTNTWKWCKGEVLSAKPNPGAGKDQRTGEENYFECSRCSYKCIVHTFVLPSCLDLSSQSFSYETWKRVAANILTTVMKIWTIFVRKLLIRLLLSDCHVKVYILYPSSPVQTTEAILYGYCLAIFTQNVIPPQPA